MRRGHVAIATVTLFNGDKAVILAAPLLAFQQIEHALDQIVDVEQLQLRGAVVDRERLVVGHRPAEGRNGRIVLRAAVPHEVGETVDRHHYAIFLPIVEEQLLSRQLGSAVVALTVAPDQRRLDGRGQHDGRFVVVLLDCIQQRGGKAKIALHELLIVLRAVHASEVEHEVAVCAVCIQLLRRAVDVVAVDVVDVDVRACAVLAVSDVFQVVDESRADHALRAGDEDVHFFPASQLANASRT